MSNRQSSRSRLRLRHHRREFTPNNQMIVMKRMVFVVGSLLILLSLSKMLTVSTTLRYLNFGGIGQEEIVIIMHQETSRNATPSLFLAPSLPQQEQQQPPKVEAEYIINYGLDSSKFVREILYCLEDFQCKMQYIHFQKTGGTDIEQKFYQITNMRDKKVKAFVPHVQYNASSCQESAAMYFLDNVGRYCQSKFFSLETTAGLFLNTVVPTCMEYYEKQQKPQRLLILMSFRQPLERLLSHIQYSCF
jgi:hypothetical protein